MQTYIENNMELLNVGSSLVVVLQSCCYHSFAKQRATRACATTTREICNHIYLHCLVNIRTWHGTFPLHGKRPSSHRVTCTHTVFNSLLLAYLYFFMASTCMNHALDNMITTIHSWLARFSLAPSSLQYWTVTLTVELTVELPPWWEPLPIHVLHTFCWILSLVPRNARWEDLHVMGIQSLYCGLYSPHWFFAIALIFNR